MVLPIAAKADPVTLDFIGTTTAASGIYSSIPNGAYVSGTITLNYANAIQTFGVIGSSSSDWTAQSVSTPTTLPTSVLFGITVNVGGFTYASTLGTYSEEMLVEGLTEGTAFQAHEESEPSSRIQYSSSIDINSNGGGAYSSTGVPIYMPGPTASANGDFNYYDGATGSSSGVAFTITSLTPAVSLSGGSGTSTDGPIPAWALGALGAGLVGIASRRLKRAA